MLLMGLVGVVVDEVVVQKLALLVRRLGLEVVALKDPMTCSTLGAEAELSKARVDWLWE